MPTLTHTSVLKGPVVIERGGVTIWSRSPVNYTINEEVATLTSDSHGPIDTICKSRHAVISLTPSMLTSGLAALAWPFAATMPGTSICGSADVPTVIHCLGEQKKITFPRTGVIKMPDLDLTLGNPIIGEMQIGAVPASSTDLEDDESLIAIAADTTFTDATFDPSKVIAGPFTFGWGAIAASIVTEAGVKLTFETEVTLEQAADMGAFDWALKSVGVTGSFIPVNLSLEDILALQCAQGAGNGIGARGSARAANFTASATGFALTVNKCAVSSGAQARFGSDTRRPGTVNFRAHRSFSQGLMTALFSLGTGA